MTCQNKTSWPGFGSIPTSSAIFVKIGDGWVTPMVAALMFPLLKASKILSQEPHDQFDFNFFSGKELENRHLCENDTPTAASKHCVEAVF